MNILTIDFETFYDSEFSLTKLTTEEYIRDERFEVIGVSVQVNDGEPKWFTGTRSEIKQFLEGYDFPSHLALAHNAMFDAAILGWHFGICPRGWLDTLSMARAVHGTEVGGSLATLAQHYAIGVKGEEVIAAKGLRRLDFNPTALARYGEYCCNDVALTYDLFKHLSAEFPKSELRLIDLTIRMFSEPTLYLNADLLRSHLIGIQNGKKSLLEAVTMVDKDQLMSNHKLAATLRLFNVEPPMKISPTTGKETFAFSKTDEAFKALLEHQDPNVQAVVAARLGVKSTIEETRTERFIGISERGPMPVPLRYYAAHTGRWGGDDKLNLQNLPRSSPLKKAIVAPIGYVICDSDSSQIEARTLAWLAGQNDLVEAFEKGEDVYKIMAAAIYAKAIADIDKGERFVGKTTILGCFGADTRVLTGGGWKRIVDVQATDTVWDGEEWVTHQGVIPQGEKATIRAWGVDATPDHEILTEHGWREWCEVTTSHSLSQSAFVKARSLSPDGSSTRNRQAVQPGGTPLFDAIVGGKDWLTATTLKPNAQHVATHAPKARLTQLAKSIGATKTLFPILNIVNAYLTELRVFWLDATQKLVRLTRITEDAASSCMSLGAQTAPRFCATSYHSPTGMMRPEISTAWTTPKGTSPATYALQHVAKTQGISEESVSCSRSLMTYDIAYAGPRNRYMIATDAGALIVHNCGYGMGAKKFQAALKNAGVYVELEEAQRIIDTYRTTNDSITELWRKAHEVLDWIANDQTGEFGRDGLLKVDGKRGIRLPNGMYVKYPNLRKRQDPESGKYEYVYDTKKGKTVVPNRIYGGKVVENVCQALARIIIGEQMLMVAKKYRVVMTVHDAIACLIPEHEAENGKEYVELCMRLRPSWAPDLPLNCEAGYGASYGDC